MNMKTKAFDCVAASRQWREAAGAKLNAMSAEEERAYLHALGEQARPLLRRKLPPPQETVMLREDPPNYGGTNL